MMFKAGRPPEQKRVLRGAASIGTIRSRKPATNMKESGKKTDFHPFVHGAPQGSRGEP